jgi:Tfp pilus assembly protein FimT
LIEVLVTVVILCLLAAMPIPYFRQSLDRAEVNAVIDELLGTLHLARLEAIRSRTPVLIHRLTDCPANSGNAGPADWHCGWRTVRDQNRNGKPDEGDTVLQVNRLSMHPWGGTTPLADRFVISSSNQTSVVATVCMSSGGRTRTVWDQANC